MFAKSFNHSALSNFIYELEGKIDYFCYLNDLPMRNIVIDCDEDELPW